MFTRNFIKLRAEVHELSYSQRKKLSDNAENNTAVASTGSDDDDDDDNDEMFQCLILHVFAA